MRLNRPSLTVVGVDVVPRVEVVLNIAANLADIITAISIVRCLARSLTEISTVQSLV